MWVEFVRLCQLCERNKIDTFSSILHLFQACDELQIFCSTCTPTQLAALKLARVLPISAAQCGLITKSDAERLCSLLLQQQPTQRSPLSSPPPPPSSPAVSPPRGDPTQFRVQHKCFGDCVGILHPQSYSSPGARCIGRGTHWERDFPWITFYWFLCSMYS